jgi:hypothetical protein
MVKKALIKNQSNICFVFLVNNVCGETNDCTTGQLCLPNLSLRAKRVCQCADNAGLQCLLRERPPPPPPPQHG